MNHDYICIFINHLREIIYHEKLVSCGIYYRWIHFSCADVNPSALGTAGNIEKKGDASKDPELVRFE